MSARLINTSTCAAVAPGRTRRVAGRWRRAWPPLRGGLGLLAAGALAGGLTSCGGGSAPSAGALLKETFSPQKRIASGRVEVSFALSAPATRGAPGDPRSFSLRIAGPFQSTGAGRLARFALALTLASGGHTLNAGAVSTAGRLYLELGGVAFLAPAATARALEQGYAQVSDRRSAGGSRTRGRSDFALLGIDPGAWLTQASRARSARIAGVDTVHIVAGLDTARFLADAGRLASAGAALGGAGGASVLTPAQLAALSRSVRSTRVDVYTGSQDHLLRRLALSIELSTTSSAQATLGGAADRRITFALALAEPNRPQAIAAPSNPQPLSQLGPALERLGTARGLTPR